MPTVVPAVQAALPAAAALSHPDELLEQSLERARTLVQRVQAYAAQFDFGDLDLPPVVGSADDQARLQAVAPMYFCAELESVRLLPVVETLAALWAGGGLQADLGAAGAQLRQFQRARHERLTVEEREAIFGRLFGKAYGPTLAVGDGSRNVGFEPLMIEFAAALSDTQTDVASRGRPSSLARVAATGAQLAANLVPRAGGVTAFASREILAAITTALAILGQTPLQRALGATSVWGGVRTAARRWLRQEVDVESHVSRARSGLVILEWLSESLVALQGIGPAPAVTDDLAVQAVAWMQATLTLHERGRNDARGTSPLEG